MRQLLLFFFAIIFNVINYGQEVQLSPQAEVSILTVAPGKELYDTFGHSAIRILDRENNLDRVYNYGMYDFDTQNFYTKFARGKLLYDLASYPFYRFLKGYSQENRAVKEQILQLSLTQKQHYFNFLQNNAKPENKSYLYDFFFDNCATRLRDVNTAVLGKAVNYKDELLKDDFTFRDLIYQKLESHPWGKFGIDLALGSIIDKKATPKQYTFLPEYVSKGFESAVIKKDGKEIPLVKQTLILYQQKEKKIKSTFLSPLLFFSIVALLIIWLSYHNYRKGERTKFIDFILFFSTGLAGVLVLFLWSATDHKATVDNYNIFWAFAPNLIVGFILLKNKLPNWLKIYLLVLLGLLILTVILWLIKVQIFSVAVIPILIILAVRYLLIYKDFQRKAQS